MVNSVFAPVTIKNTQRVADKALKERVGSDAAWIEKEEKRDGEKRDGE